MTADYSHARDWGDLVYVLCGGRGVAEGSVEGSVKGCGQCVGQGGQGGRAIVRHQNVGEDSMDVSARLLSCEGEKC